MSDKDCSTCAHGSNEFTLDGVYLCSKLSVVGADDCRKNGFKKHEPKAVAP